MIDYVLINIHPRALITNIGTFNAGAKKRWDEVFNPPLLVNPLRFTPSKTD
jgi:hypothetical protein